jgi:hypothetical protein
LPAQPFSPACTPPGEPAFGSALRRRAGAGGDGQARLPDRNLHRPNVTCAGDIPSQATHPSAPLSSFFKVHSICAQRSAHKPQSGVCRPMRMLGAITLRKRNDILTVTSSGIERTHLKILQAMRKQARRTKARKVASRLSCRTVNLRNPPFSHPKNRSTLLRAFRSAFRRRNVRFPPRVPFPRRGFFGMPARIPRRRNPSRIAFAS